MKESQKPVRIFLDGNEIDHLTQISIDLEATELEIESQSIYEEMKSSVIVLDVEVPNSINEVYSGLMELTDPVKNPDLVISQKECFELFQGKVRERMEKMDIGFVEAVIELESERNTIWLKKFEAQKKKKAERIKALINSSLEICSVFAQPSDTGWLNLQESISKGCAGLQGINFTHFIIDEAVILGAGSAIRDGLANGFSSLKDSVEELTQVLESASCSAYKYRDMMNTLKKQELVLFPKVIGPKEYGMNLKRNQRRNG